jgi:hypothetical protein
LALELLEDRKLLSYSFTLLADTDPNGPFRSLLFLPAINSKGTVVFEAVQTRAAGEVHGVFTSQNPTRPLYGSPDSFSSLQSSPTINEDGTVAFGAEATGGGLIGYLGDGGPLTTLADTTGPFRNLTALAVLNNQGTASFGGDLTSGGSGIFTGHGGPPAILYVTGGLFSSFPETAHAFNDSGTVAFRATLTAGGQGIFRGNGGTVTTIADTSSGVFSSFGRPALNEEGTVAFLANRSDGSKAILTGRGKELTTVADTSGLFNDFSSLAIGINSEHGVVFFASLATGGAGIFTGPDPVADKVIAIGDPLFGSTVRAFISGGGGGFSFYDWNDAGQLAFRAALDDGREVFGLADPHADRASPSARRQWESFAALVHPTGRDSFTLVQSTSEPNAPRVIRGAQPAEMTLRLVTGGSLQPDQSARPQSVSSALVSLARRRLINVVFGQFQHGTPNDTLSKELAIARQRNEVMAV